MKKTREILAGFCGTTVILLLVLAVTGAAAVLGGKLMMPFGLRYSSVGSLILFFAVSGLCSFPLELLSGALPLALYRLGRILRVAARVMHIAADAVCSYLAMSLVNAFMDSVDAAEPVMAVCSLAMALPDGDFRKKLAAKNDDDAGEEP